MKAKDVLVILSKKPKIGKTKTRIAQDAGKSFALKLSIASLKDLIANLKGSNKYDLLVATDTRDDLYWFREHLKINGFVIKMDERKKGTSELLSLVFSHLSLRYEKIILIPMDVPYIEKKLIEKYFQKLNIIDYIIGPTPEGGVYLIGMKKGIFTPNLFKKVSWGISSSEDLLRNFNKPSKMKLRPLQDLDHFSDLSKTKILIKKYCPNIFSLLKSEKIIKR